MVWLRSTASRAPSRWLAFEVVRRAHRHGMQCTAGSEAESEVRLSPPINHPPPSTPHPRADFVQRVHLFLFTYQPEVRLARELLKQVWMVWAGDGIMALVVGALD